MTPAFIPVAAVGAGSGRGTGSSGSTGSSGTGSTGTGSTGTAGTGTVGTGPAGSGTAGTAGSADASLVLPEVDLGRRFVRIRGRQDNGFIEFNFSVGWPDLVVELVLAPADFETFCRENDVRILPPASADTDAEGDADVAGDRGH